MAHINGIVNMMNSLQYSISNCNSTIMDVLSRLKIIEDNTINAPPPISTPLPQAQIQSQHDHLIPILKSDLDTLRSKLVHLESVVRDVVVTRDLGKERAIIENTVTAKVEESIKLMLRERVASETQTIMNTLKTYIDEQMEQQRERDMSDVVSVAPSMSSGRGGKRGGKKQILDIIA